MKGAIIFNKVAVTIEKEELTDLEIQEVVINCVRKECESTLLTYSKDNQVIVLSFLIETTVVDVENQLRFDILKDVYLTKKKENEELKTAAEVKAHNQKILALIAEKKEGELKELSVEELEKLLK